LANERFAAPTRTFPKAEIQFFNRDELMPCKIKFSERRCRRSGKSSEVHSLRPNDSATFSPSRLFRASTGAQLLERRHAALDILLAAGRNRQLSGMSACASGLPPRATGSRWLEFMNAWLLRAAAATLRYCAALSATLLDRPGQGQRR